MFEGGWSYTHEEITELFKHLKFSQEYSVLEFGSGDSTVELYNKLREHVENLTYYTYESDISYMRLHDDIKWVHYDENDIQNTQIPDVKFDLILIDGPGGEKRQLWYSKLRNNVKPGTVVLIDDFNHFKSFSDELDNNFKYDTLSLQIQPILPGNKSWKIVEIISPKSTNPLTNKNSVEHLELFINKLKNGEPFSFIRPNDGEYLIMTGHNFATQDRWSFSGGRLIDDLFTSISKMISLPNAYVGIPCKGCYDDIYNWYISRFNIPSEKLTYGNLVCNANWSTFTNLFTKHNLPFYYIGPYKSNHHNLNLLDKFVIDEYLIHNWDTEKETVLEDVRKWVSDKSGIFTFSAGPLTKVFIPMLAEAFPNNTYIDAGSSLDLFMKGSTNRLYVNPNDTFSNVVCDFNKGHILRRQSSEGDITAILTVYKRPQYLQEQLEALYNQTIKPKTVIIIKNFVEGVAIPNLPEHLVTNVKFIASNTNFGVWARFAIGLLADTKYVCMFDDDTIPGSKWFENCIDSMSIREGLYGTIGIRFPTPCYGWSHSDRVGWHNPNTEIEEVDIVGHAWFLKREWIRHLWNYTPSYTDDLKCGEDINLSFYLQKVGIPTLVPPHPPGCYEMYGSHPVTAWNYGTDENALSSEAGAHSKFDISLSDAIKNGFVLMCMKK
jgi:hypothetical protein